MSTYGLGLRPEQIDDLVNNTLNHYEKDKFVDIALNLQQYLSDDLLDAKIEIDGGKECQWQVKVRNSGAARNTGLYAVDQVTVVDVTKNASVPWTMQTTNFAYDINEEAFNNPSGVRILNLLKPRVHAALSDLAELMEDNFWGLPANTTDEAELKKPRGIPYWIVRNATQGFNGAVPIGGGHTTVANLNPTTYPNWANWTDQFTSLSTTDFIRKVRKAMRQTHFKAPVKHAGQDDVPRRCCATTEPTFEKLIELLEQRNENLGRDLAWGENGSLLIKRFEVKWVPKLDELHDETGVVAGNHYGKNPFYGIDKNVFKAVCLKGKFMVRSKPITAPQQHTVRHVHYDSWTQFKCTNRRNNFVLTQTA